MVVGEYYNGSIVCVPCEQEDGLLSVFDHRLYRLRTESI